MKLSKEVWATVAIIGFLLSYLIDRIAGPVSIIVGNPIAFLSSSTLLSRYPFTATAIVIRTLAIFISVMVVAGLINGKYFIKAVTLLFLGILSEFFAIQQLATGFRITTIQWTLSIAYASILLVFGIIAVVLKGIWASFNQKEEQENPTDSGESDGQDKSILEP